MSPFWEATKEDGINEQFSEIWGRNLMLASCHTLSQFQYLFKLENVYKKIYSNLNL